MQIPPFPMFLRQGRVQTNIFLYESRRFVTYENLMLLKEFHHYIFDSILRLVKGGFAFVPDKAPVNILIVPLRRGLILSIILLFAYFVFIFEMEFSINFLLIRKRLLSLKVGIKLLCSLVIIYNKLILKFGS